MYAFLFQNLDIDKNCVSITDWFVVCAMLFWSYVEDPRSSLQHSAGREDEELLREGARGSRVAVGERVDGDGAAGAVRDGERLEPR